MHLLNCPHMAKSRADHRVDYYRELFDYKYYFSIKFLRWVHCIFAGTHGTESDDPNEFTFPPRQTDDTDDTDISLQNNYYNYRPGKVNRKAGERQPTQAATEHVPEFNASQFVFNVH